MLLFISTEADWISNLFISLNILVVFVIAGPIELDEKSSPENWTRLCGVPRDPGPLTSGCP